MPETILIVEDDYQMRKDVAKILEIDGYNIIEAKDGTEALELLDDHGPIDLVISDIMMAEMSGLALFKEFKKRSEFIHIPFVFLTAMTHPIDIDSAQRQGVDAYITKPFEVSNLLSIVRGRIEKSKRVRDVQDQTIDDINNRLLMTFSHEFRTPLTLIVAYAEMLRDWDKNMPDEEVETFLNGVRSGANRMNRLVEKIVLLIELTTKEGIKKYTAWSKIIPAQDLKMILDMVIKNIQNSKTICNIEVEGEINKPIYGYDEYIRKLFTEIIENGVKFSQDKKLLINIFQSDNLLSISFKNMSIKIPDDEIENLKKPFYQYDREHYEFQGIGAGLSIAKGICELHNADLKMEQIDGYMVVTVSFSI